MLKNLSFYRFSRVFGRVPREVAATPRRLVSDQCPLVNERPVAVGFEDAIAAAGPGDDGGLP